MASSLASDNRLVLTLHDDRVTVYELVAETERNQRAMVELSPPARCDGKCQQGDRSHGPYLGVQEDDDAGENAWRVWRVSVLTWL